MRMGSSFPLRTAPTRQTNPLLRTFFILFYLGFVNSKCVQHNKHAVMFQLLGYSCTTAVIHGTTNCTGFKGALYSK
jgi:hypothetical protein